jgi:ankyrin repeat protein
MTESHGETALYVAARLGYINVVKALLECDALNVNKPKLDGVTPLIEAARFGHINVVKALLACEEIEVNRPMLNKATPLFIAAQNGHINVVKVLLECVDIDVNSGISMGTTPLFIAAQNGRVEIIAELLKKPLIKESLNAPMKANIAILLSRAKASNRCIEVHKLLQSKGITSMELNGFTPLCAAIFFGHTDIVKMLIKQGADLNHTTQGRISCLEFAQAMNHQEITELLMCAQTKVVEQVKEYPLSEVKSVTIHIEKDIENSSSKPGTSKIFISPNDILLQSGSDHRSPLRKGQNLRRFCKKSCFFCAKN